MQKLRAALCALVCVWAGQAWADSSASLRVLKTVITLTDLNPGDGMDQNLGGNGHLPAFETEACVGTLGAMTCVIPTSADAEELKESSISDPFGSASASNFANQAGGTVASPLSGAHSFRAMAYAGYGGVILDAWTQVTYSVDFEAFATGSGSAYALVNIAGSSAFVTVRPADQQGLRTLSVTVSNPTDDWQWGSSGQMGFTLIAQGQAAAVPEPSSAALCVLGLLALHRYARNRIKPLRTSSVA